MQMTAMNSALRIPSSALESWLPDLDLNQDKQIQSLLCYRYTIGQAEAVSRLKVFINPSSRHTEAGVKKRCLVDAPARSPQERTLPTFIAACAPEPAGVRSASRDKSWERSLLGGEGRGVNQAHFFDSGFGMAA